MIVFICSITLISLLSDPRHITVDFCSEYINVHLPFFQFCSTFTNLPSLHTVVTIFNCHSVNFTTFHTRSDHRSLIPDCSSVLHCISGVGRLIFCSNFITTQKLFKRQWKPVSQNEGRFLFVTVASSNLNFLRMAPILG
jgi:hypothetical protein